MNAMGVSLVAFGFIFGGALLGMLARTALPEHHLNAESKDLAKLGMGLIVTMCALVLGLLIASAKSYYDTQSAELTDMSAKVVLLDRVLAHYGPESNEARAILREGVNRLIDRLEQQGFKLDSPATGSELLYDKTQGLTPKDDRQRSIQSQALSLELALGESRWLMFEQGTAPLPRPFVIIMIFWLTIIFISWGVFAPRNASVVAVLCVTAFSVSSAIFLILEMFAPYEGLIHISTAPLRAALAHLSQ